MNSNLIYMASALLFWGLGEGMFFNFVPIYMERQFSLNEQVIGFMLGAFGLIMAVTHIPSGYVSDRIGRRPLLWAAWIMGLLSSLIMGVALSLPLFLLGYFLYALTAFVASPLNSYVTAARGSMPTATALALISFSFNIGMALGPVTGGWISEIYGMRTIYLFAAAVFVISTVFIFLLKDQQIDEHNPESPPEGLWRNKPLVRFFGLMAFAVFAMYLSQPLTPNFLEGVRGFSLGETGWIFSAGALGNSLLALGLSRIKPHSGFLIAQSLVVFFNLCMWLGSGLPVFMLGYFLLGGFRAARPMFFSYGRDLVHASQMGLLYGTMETLSAIVFIITPPLAGYLFELDPYIVYPVSATLVLASIAAGSIRFSGKEQSHA